MSNSSTKPEVMFPVQDSQALENLQNNISPSDWEIDSEEGLSHYEVESVLYTLARRLSELGSDENPSNLEDADIDSPRHALLMFQNYAKSMGDNIATKYFDSYLSSSDNLDKTALEELAVYYSSLVAIGDNAGKFVPLAKYMSNNLNKEHLIHYNGLSSEFSNSRRVIDYAKRRLDANPAEIKDWDFDATQMIIEEAIRVIESFDEEVVTTPKDKKEKRIKKHNSPRINP